MAILKMLLLTNLLLLLPIPLHSANTYNAGSPVPFFANKIGPFHNPSETYQYYELPFCRTGQVVEKKESLGEVLNSDRLMNALYELEFAVNKTWAILCHQTLDRNDVAKFRDAIMNDFYYQMYYDDLPLWAFIGRVEDENWTVDQKGPKYFLFTHVHFDALYQGNQVIEIHAFSDPSHVVDVTDDVSIEVEFTYSAHWNTTSTTYDKRMDRYSSASLNPILRQIHWFSFVNSMVTLILLIGLLTVLIVQRLKNDLRRVLIVDEDEDKEVSRKHTHGHVFGSPKNLPLFSAVLGCGAQLLIMIFILCLLAFLGIIHPYSRGALSSFTFTIYILSSVVAGYRSTSFCNQYTETSWERSTVLAGIVFLGPFICVAFLVNIIAAYYGATAALPVGTIILIFLAYIIVAIPLLILGGMAGHRSKSSSHTSPVSKKYPREIQSLVWYRKIPAEMFIAGLLPFSAVFLELRNLYATLWGYKIYTSPGILFFTFTILVMITAVMSVGLTYFQLAADDHDWWWRSVLRGGSTAVFMFCYCIYFYLKSSMIGILQASFFFGYNACLCYAVFLVLGTVSFQASLLFVGRIWHCGKSE